MDEESKAPLIIALAARMAKKILKTPDNNSGVQRSTRVKYLVQIFTYDGFVTHHYIHGEMHLNICIITKRRTEWDPMPTP